MARRKISRVKLVIIIGGVILVLLIFSLIKEMMSRRQIDQEISTLKNQIITLESENWEVANFINEWESGDQAEKQARIKLGLKKPNEKVVIITRQSPEDEKNPLVAGETEIVGHIVKTKENGTPNPVKWWRYFFSMKKN